MAQFRSLDPLTQQLPDDVDAGFLPVNDKLIGNGEGFLSYSVRSVNGLSTGTEITNTAEIIFDLNDPILTSDGAQHDRRRDTVQFREPNFRKPSEHPVLASLGEDTTMQVALASQTMTFFVSENEGPFEPWLLGTTQTSEVFTSGVSGTTYSFISIARDRVGNVESMSSLPDTQTLVIIGCLEQSD